jgi:uncharacterized protein
MMNEWMTPASRARWIPFALFMGLLAARGAWPAEGLFGLDARWLYAVSVVVVGGALIVCWRQYDELRGAQQRPTWFSLLVAAVVGVVVFKLWVELTDDWMFLEQPAATFKPVDVHGHLIWPMVAFRWVGATLVVPVMEELFWRSFLMRWIDTPDDFQKTDPRQASWKAIVMSSGVFALAHSQWLAAIVTGVIYAWLYKRYGKLWVPVVAHAVTNGVLGIWVVVYGNWVFW